MLGVSERIVMAVLLLAVLAMTMQAEETEAALRARAGKAIGTPNPATIDYPSGVPPTAAEVALGATLFFDPRLSQTQTESCASCHDPERGLGDGLARSRGVMGNVVARNAPHLYNLAWTPLLFWDGRAASLEEQAVGPIQSPGEMAMPLPALLARLNGVPGYRTAFAAAYGPGPATKESLAAALAAFERTLIVRDTPYDRWQAGDDRAMAAPAKRGLTLFLGKADCIACHSGPNLSDGSFHRIGVSGNDRGRAAIVAGSASEGAFKTPGLRNTRSTAPYFHDGSAPTLEEVLRFYNRGGDALTTEPLVRKLGLSDPEIDDVIAFLDALSQPLPVTKPALPAD